MPKIEIHITFDPATGQVQVMGPLDMKGPMINTLATAIQIVVNHQPVVQPQILVHPGQHKGPIPQPPNGKDH